MEKEYLLCVNCECHIPLTYDRMYSYERVGFIECECGIFLQPNGIEYDEAKDSIKKRKRNIYVTCAIALFLSVIAISYKMFALLPIITTLTGVFISDQNKIEKSIQVETKLSSQNNQLTHKFNSISEFKSNVKQYNIGFNKVFSKCCICDSLTQQTVSNLPLCSNCFNKK